MAQKTRRYDVDLGGESISIDWDDSKGPLTKAKVMEEIQRRRNKPVDPSLTKREEPTSANKPLTTTPPAENRSIWDRAKDFGAGVIDPVMDLGHHVGQTGKEASDAVLRGDFGGAVTSLTRPVMAPFRGEGLAGIPSMGRGEAAQAGAEQLGIPATKIASNIKTGNYERAAGQAVGTAAMLYGGHKIGKALETQPTIKPPPGVVPRPAPDPTLPGIPRSSPPPPSRPSATIPDPTVVSPPPSRVMPEKEPTQPGLFDEPTQRRLFNDDPILKKAAENPNPEIQKAAVQTSRFQQLRNSPLGKVVADVAKSGMSVINDSGKAGVELARKLTRTRLDSDELAGRWKIRAEKATEGLSPEQVEAYVRSRDTGEPVNDPAVIRALQERAQLDTEMVSAMQATGSGFRTADGKKIIPFREKLNHWPHIYPKEFFKNKETAIKAMMDDGMSYEEALTAARNANRFGERLINAQNERQSNAPGYRTDLEADYLHINDFAKRITEAKEYGPLDLADSNSPLSKLISETDDPPRVGELVSRHLGRDVPPDAAWSKVNKRIIQVETAAHLSMFAISNMAQLATIPLRSNLTSYAKALAKTIGKSKDAKMEAEKTGALQTIHQDLMREMGGEGMISKIFMMKKSETFNRTVAAIAGKGTAESLFQTLKKNPNNKRARERLENLILEPIDTILKQPTLTEQQAGRAGGRMAEITQGRAQSIDLPKMWSDHPGAELLLLYKKYAFRQTRIIRDAIAENPTRNIPLAIALYGTFGEAIGDAKAGIKGAVSGQGAGEAIQERGADAASMFESAGVPEDASQVAGRISANLGQAWALGILADALGSATSGQTGMLKFLAGPVLGDATEIGGAIGQGDTGKLVGKVAASVPVVGSGLRARNSGTTKRKRSLPSLPRLPSLPKIPRP